MANENEGQAQRDYKNRKKLLKRRRRAIIVFLFLLIVIAGSIYIISLYNRSYDSYTIVKTKDITGTNIGYVQYGSAIIKYSRDGAEAVDKNGSLLWNGSYEMSEPMVDTCGQYAVIAEKDGKSIHIFNQKGEVNNFTTLYDILKVEVSSRGIVVALMEDGDGNHIELFATDGTILWEKKTSENGEGYPMDISISSDAKKVVISYLSYKGGKLIDSISFYNLGEVGKNASFDGWVGGKSFPEGNIVPRVAFVNKDTACLFKGDGLFIYPIKERPENPYKVDFTGRIQSVLYNQKYVGVVLQAEGTSSKQILIYNLKGKKILDKPLDFNYDKIYLADNEIIMYDSSSCIIMKWNGKIKFRYTFDSNIDAVYPINNLDRYFIANESKLLEVQLEE